MLAVFAAVETAVLAPKGQTEETYPRGPVLNVEWSLAART